jgi:spectinomycin phosphotransferase
VQIIAPLLTETGQLWASLDAFKLILYPFVDGHNGYENDLSDRHWVELGTALKSIHTAGVPSALLRGIPQETYSPQWRDSVLTFMERVETDAWHDPIAVKSAAFLKTKRGEIPDLTKRAERLAQTLQARSPELVVCQSDLHAGNILIDAKGALYIVDWDHPILAPKERDLMFSGGGQFGTKRAPQEEEILFYRGYGQTQIDPRALAYYRYERIIEDIADFCEPLLLTNAGGEDREQAFQYLTSNFLRNGTLEIAYNSDKTQHNAW